MSSSKTYMERLFSRDRSDRFILGVSDMVPPDAKWERLVRMAEMVEGRAPAAGTVNPSNEVARATQARAGRPRCWTRNA